jgi:hypothetical protein
LDAAVAQSVYIGLDIAHKRASSATQHSFCDAAKAVMVRRQRMELPMGDLILTTFDWVPEIPRSYLRDLRVRWALEEGGRSDS